MTRTVQRRWEQYYLEVFGRLRLDLVPTTLVPADPPAPDSLLIHEGRTRGIELTRFVRDAIGPGGSPSLALHALRTRIVEHAAAIWTSRQLPHVDVGLIWDDHHDLSAADVSTLADRLVEIVAGHVPNLDAHLTIAYPEPYWKDLPKQIAAVFVSRPAWLTQSIWDFSRLGAVPHVRDIFPRLQQILDEKEGKIPGYLSQCDEVCLLIVADASTMQSYVVVDENNDLPIHDLVSSFDRAYFLSATHQCVVELSLSRP